MEDWATKILVGLLINAGLISYVVTKLKKIVKSTENKWDDELLKTVPSILKALISALKDYGLGNKDVIKILNAFRNQYIEQEDETKGQVIDKVDEKIKGGLGN